MHVEQIWRYPVKSLQGESLTAATVGPFGLVGDRTHALRDPETGVVLTARRDPKLLYGWGVLNGEEAAVDVPGHGPTTDDAVISAWIGRPVRLLGPTGEAQTYENLSDPEHDDSDPVAWEGPTWSYHDSTRTQVSIVAVGDLRDWDVRRFRPNLVVSGDTADGLVGRRLRIGGAEVDVVKKIGRCVMITRDQPDGIDRDLEVLRTLRRDRDLTLVVGSLVVSPGSVQVGDELEDLGPASS